jgi:hypothetical protein
MGGQACVLCGAAEFSRDTDLVILADSANLRRHAASIHSRSFGGDGRLCSIRKSVSSICYVA